MMRGLVVGAGAAAVLVAGLTGCSDKKSESSPGTVTETASITSPAASVTSGSMTASAGAGTATVSIDGKPREMQGQIVCTTAMDKLNIAIGESATGVAVVMSPDASGVTSVALGNVDGVSLGYQEGAPGGQATATKDGQNYTISGTATGIDMANPMQPMTKPFEIEVTCP